MTKSLRPRIHPQSRMHPNIKVFVAAIVVAVVILVNLNYKNTPYHFRKGQSLLLRPYLAKTNSTAEEVPSEKTANQKFHKSLAKTNSTAEEVPSEKTANQKFHKSFLYMTQTEHCLPDQLRNMNALGDSTVRDVIVVSYKKNCTDTSLPHVHYMFNTSTTWTTGRTELYYAAKRLNKKYLYYIFLDDDIKIVPIFTNLKSSSWWRTYEQFLLDNRPPLAALDNPDWQLVDKIRRARSREHCTMNGTDPDYYLAKWFDAVVNAFHYDAVVHLFEPITPYWTRFDSVSWWIAQWYVNIMTDIVFHNQAMLPAHLMAYNPVHRPYPKRIHNRKDLEVIADDIRKIIPQQYRKSADLLLKGWTSAYAQILTTIKDTYCHPIPSPRQELIPYQRL